ncbi:hypothetical protein [Methanosphaera sp.]
MSFMDKIKEKLVNMSNSYNFYKSNYEQLKIESNENKKLIRDLTQENSYLIQQNSELEKENAVLYNENKNLLKENRKQFKVDERQTQLLKELMKLNKKLEDNFDNFHEKTNELTKKIEYDNVISSNNYKNIESITTQIHYDLEQIENSSE